MNKDDWNKEPESQADPEAQIDAMMANLTVEKAPASLTRRLRRIPREQRPKADPWSWLPFGKQSPGWALAPAFALVPLLVLAVVLMQKPQHSAADIEQARQDLAVAFAYIDKAGGRTGHEIQTVLGGELRQTVKGNLSKHIPFTNQSLEEEST